MPLEYRASAGRLELEMPSRPRTSAPPGHYLLFVVDAAGVPSEGAMIKLGQPLLRPGEDLLKSTLEPGAGPITTCSPRTGRWSWRSSADAPVELRVARDAPFGTARRRRRPARRPERGT